MEVWEIWRLKIVKIWDYNCWRSCRNWFSRGSKIGVEEYWDMFMSNETVEFQCERAWEWSLEKLWCVICNGVVSVYEIVYEKWRKKCLEI